MKRFSKFLVLVVFCTLFLMAGTLVFAGGKAESQAVKEVTVNIALANNPISQALARIAKEEYKTPGITVNIAVLPENDLRQKLTTEASTGGTTYDVFFIGPYEANNWAKNGWLENMEPYFKALSADKLAW